ncbi:MAG: hypothetical protein IPJ84_14820 [Bdellovibrionales bacterium]|jgi:hypothetical protein|nr:hypothetical protein [Bdellovibrionales bacterium]
MKLTFFLKLVGCIIIGMAASANSASAATKMTKLEAIEHAMSLVEPKRQLLEDELVKLYTRGGRPTLPQVFPKPSVTANGLYLGMPENYTQVYSVNEGDEITHYKFSVRKCHGTSIGYCPALWEYVSSTPILSITYKDNIDSAGNKVGCFVNISTNSYSLFSMGVVAVRWNPRYAVGSDGDVVHPLKVAYMLESFEALGCN